MKDSVLKLTLDEDLNVKYEAGANILNQHSASRQYIEVTLKGFALAEDERLYVAFTYAGGKNITTAYIYLPCEEGIYRTEIPYDVYSLRGRWKGNFAVKSDWVTATDADGYPLLDEDGNEIKRARRAKTSKEFDFEEYSVIESNGLPVPTETDIFNYYQNAQTAVNKIKEQSEKIDEILNGETKLDLNYNATTEELTFSVIKETN